MTNFQQIQIYVALPSKSRACDLGPTGPLFILVYIHVLMVLLRSERERVAYVINTEFQENL